VIRLCRNFLSGCVGKRRDPHEEPETRTGHDLRGQRVRPYSKATFALRRHFPDDDRRFASALVRFRAFMNLLSRGTLAPWVQQRGGGRMAIHPAALDVASQFKVSANGRFPPRKFLRAVAEVAAYHYASLEGWPARGAGVPA
jgi:hypothetical protein